MKVYKLSELKILEKMLDEKGWSASQLEKKLKMPKGNISSRCLHPMENKKVIYRKEDRKTESSQSEKPYYISKDMNVYQSIANQLIEKGMHKKFLISKYTNNMIKEHGFKLIYDVIVKSYLKSDSRKTASKSLLKQSASVMEYRNFAENLQKNISEMRPQRTNTSEFDKYYLYKIVREIGEELSPNQIEHIEMLRNFETVESVRFYRENIHMNIIEGLNELARKNVITEGLKSFLIFDNYLSPLTSYPINSTLQLIFAQPFQRIYEDAYLLLNKEKNGKNEGIKLLSLRAYEIYKNFPDILFDYFKSEPPEPLMLELMTREMVFHWNVASTRFDLIFNQLGQLYKRRGFGNYHLRCDGLSFQIRDLDKEEDLIPIREAKSILVIGLVPRIFEEFDLTDYRGSVMMNPFTCLRPSLAFQELGWWSDYMSLDEILSSLEAKFAANLEITRKKENVS